MTKSKTSIRGYTLIELVVIITILGILAAIYIPLMMKNIDKAHIAHVTLMKETLNTAILLERSDRYIDNGKWETPINTDVTIDYMLENLNRADWTDDGNGVWTYLRTGATITYSRLSDEDYLLSVVY